MRAYLEAILLFKPLPFIMGYNLNCCCSGTLALKKGHGTPAYPIDEHEVTGNTQKIKMMRYTWQAKLL